MRISRFLSLLSSKLRISHQPQIPTVIQCPRTSSIVSIRPPSLLSHSHLLLHRYHFESKRTSPQVLSTKSGPLNPNGARRPSVPFTKNMDAGTGAPPLNYDSTSATAAAVVVVIQGKEPLVTPRTPPQKYLLRQHLPSGSRAPRGKRSPTPKPSLLRPRVSLRPTKAAILRR